MSIVKAPWTPEQVKNIQDYQSNDRMHPFTCGGAFCHRSKREDEGILIPKPDGLVCPCGQYSQNWVHEHMTQPQPEN